MTIRLPDATLFQEIRMLAESIENIRFEALSNGIGLGQFSPLVKDTETTNSSLKNRKDCSKFKDDKEKSRVEKHSAGVEGLNRNANSLVNHEPLPQINTHANGPKRTVHHPDPTKKKKVRSERNIAKCLERDLPKTSPKTNALLVLEQKANKPRVNAQKPGAVVLMRYLAIHCIDMAVVSISILSAFLLIGLILEPEGLSSKANILLSWLPVRFFLHTDLQEWFIISYGVFMIYLVFFRIFVGNTLGAYLFPSQKNKAP